MNEIELRGCRFEPLMDYFKALGVLRVLSGQKDASARGFWRTNHFVLTTELDEKALIGFFLDEYTPTPVFSPWNKGSGFYPRGKETEAVRIIRRLRDFGDLRLRSFGNAIRIIEDAIERVTGKKPEYVDDKTIENHKDDLMAYCRNALPDELLEWIDAVYAVGLDDRLKYRPVFAIVLGSGGNDGNLEFSINYLKSICHVFDTMREDIEKARRALRKIADPMGISVERAVYGMYTIVNNNMVNGIRRVTVERGYDPRDFVLVGAGGATAAHITALASAMGIDTIVLPKLASGLCAFGQIISDVKYNYMATAPLRLDNDAAYARIDELFNRIEAQGVARLRSDGFGPRDIVIRRSLDMRYVGQVHECTVEVGTFKVDARSIGKIKDAFHRRHKDLYTYAEPASTVEVVNIESTLCGVVDKPARMNIGKGVSPRKAMKGYREAVFGADGRRTRTPIYDGTPLGADAVIRGPAVI